MILNLRDEWARKDLENVYELHRTLMSPFPDENDGGPGRVLFRVEEKSSHPTGKMILLQSSHPPNWSKTSFPLDYFLVPPETNEFDPDFVTGQLLSFRLLANPTVKRDGKRLGLLKDEEQMNWLLGKGKQNGFTVMNAINMPKEDRKGMRPGRQSSMTFHSVLFEGTLKVDDPVRFKRALESGIGSAKGFGFGLLSLARLRSNG